MKTAEAFSLRVREREEREKRERGTDVEIESARYRSVKEIGWCA